MTTADAARPGRLITFSQSDSAYTRCLYAALATFGHHVIVGPWSGRWLLNTVRRGDVIHIHWPSFFYYDQTSRWNTCVKLLRFLTVLELARARGARIVWTAHNLYPHDGGKNRWEHRVARYYIVKVSERILAHGPTAAEIVAREFEVPREKILVVSHGHWIGHHPHTATKAEARARLGIDRDAYVVSFVGTCKPYKNLDLLIQTFAKLDGNCKLIIAGSFQSSTYQRHIENLAKESVADRSHIYAGMIPEDDLQFYVLAGDVLVLPYTEILTSGSAMLGLSFGIPVIAPNAGGLRDVVDKTCGELYDTNAPDGLLHALQQVRSRHYNEKAIVARARSFEWLETAQALVDLLAPAPTTLVAQSAAISQSRHV